MSDSIIRRNCHISSFSQSQDHKIKNRILVNNQHVKEIKSLHSRGYNVNDVYYDGEYDLSYELYPKPEFKTCQVKNQVKKTKTGIENLIDNGFSVYDIYYDAY